ncbi:MAG: VWA domain-containing protein [Ectothiorhodospiraceae bacterium AqS1]|nr:VWA domain-containing protein [Ectothiorhodospiraceae bacterium AqS1]
MANHRTGNFPLSPGGSRKISTSDEVDRFLKRAAHTPLSTERKTRGRLLFAMDATASREGSWDRACRIQGEMFTVTDAIGGLSVQLCHYRGFDEFEATPWLSNAKDLLQRMSAVRCAAGATQIERVLRHAGSQAGQERIDALVFVGDCVEEDVDRLCAAAGVLRLHAIPVFIFHEGYNPGAERAFQEIARLTAGACHRFDASSAAELRDLLRAVATYAAGGRFALKALGNREGGAIRLLERSLPPSTRTGE